MEVLPEEVLKDKISGVDREPRASFGHADVQSQRINLVYMLGSLRDGGAERRTLELIKHLDRRRFAVSLILMEEAGIERALDWVDRCFVMHLPGGSKSRWWARMPSLTRAVWRTRKQLIHWRSHIVHAMLPGPSIIGGVAARLAGVPVFIGSRPCLTHLYRSGGIVALADKMAFHIATMNLANSLAVGKDMVAVGGCPPRKCRTIYNGVDTQRFHPYLSRSWRTKMGWTNENVVFGVVANFHAYKRHQDLVQVAATITRHHPGARFVMVGEDYGSRAAVLQQIGDLGLKERVFVVDADPSPEKIYAAIDVYVCTSESEGFSNAILEAMACGLPVIATDVGGNAEAVSNGITGLLVPCASLGALANAITAVLQDQERRHSLGLKGRERVEQEFSLDRMISSHEQLYLQLTAKWRKTAA
jgi:glycosyltransferase involved in cell wall biosynthesis